MCRSSRPVLLGLAALLICTASSGQTLVHYYAGGEADSTAAGAAVSTTVDGGTTGTDLSLVGSGVTFSASTYDPASTLAYSFNGSGGLVGTVDSTLNSSAAFIIELRFNANSISGTQALAYNGSTGTSGIGLYLHQDQLQILRGGESFRAITTVNASTWNYAALVYDAGATYTFVNGTRFDSTFNEGFRAFDLSGEGLALGSNEIGGDRFAGLIDEVRFSTFTSGNFSESMLSFSAVPEPSTYAAIAGAAFLGFAAWRRRRVPAAVV